IGFVTPVLANRIVVLHTREWRLQLDAGLAKRCREKSFDHFKHLLLPGEGHFQIDLRKFRLTVGAKVLIAETTYDLEILVEAGNHQYLLEQLRRLRQCVKRSRRHPAGDQIIARSFRRAARHEWSLDLQKSSAGKLVANGESYSRAQGDVGLHLRAAHIDVAILQAQLLVRDLLIRR